MLQDVDCMTLLSLHLFILYNELVMLYFPSFPFIVFFLQCDLNSSPCSGFSWIKWIKTNHFWTTSSTMFLSPVSLSSCTSRFLFLQIFLLLELSFFRFQYRLSFLSICFASTVTFFKSLSNVFKRLLIFREILTP